MTTPAPSAARRLGGVPRRLRRRWRQAISALGGRRSAADLAVATKAPDTRAELDRLAAAAARQRAQAELAEAIATGASLEAATCRCVEALAATGDWRDLNTAWALTDGVAAVPAGAVAAALGRVIVLHRRQQLDRAWAIVGGIDDATLARWIPIEAVDAATAALTPEARRRALAIVGLADLSRTSVVIDLAGRLLAIGERTGAATLLAGVDDSPQLDDDPRRRDSLRLLRGWLGTSSRALPTDAVPFGILGARTPDCAPASSNLGPSIEALATLGNLVRLSGVTFTGDDGLGELATELQARVDPTLRVPEARGSIHLIGIDRDFSSVAEIPDVTWVIAVGRHARTLYDGRHDFPYHPHVRPLFVSFCVDEAELLGDDALAYLRRFGPVGCRDWTTVFLLLSAGVDAFFTGSITTTVDAIVPASRDDRSPADVVAWIDAPGSPATGAKSARRYTHIDDSYRVLSIADGLRAADDRLATYRREVRRAVTGRLQAYLALTSLGIPADLRMRSPGDVRLAGLSDLRPGGQPLAEMRDGIRDLISGMAATILGGASDEEVYASWRARTAERVADAKQRFEVPVAVPPTTIDVAGAIATTLDGAVRSGAHAGLRRDEVADVVLAFDQNLLLPAAVLIESMAVHASGPLRLWVLGRGLPSSYAGWLAAAFPSLPITVLACDGITYGPGGRPRRIPARITISTMDRLLLPDLLDEVDRVVYVDVDTLLLDDICQLARTDLGGRPVAARHAKVTETREWRRVGRHLPIDVATDLRRTMGRQHGFGHPALNAGVLVMDLDRMRRDGFIAASFALVEHYGLNDQDTMLAYVGPERCVLDPAWNALPILEDVTDPRIIHWASLGKPWEPELTYGQARWREHATRLLGRAGPPPDAGG